MFACRLLLITLIVLALVKSIESAKKAKEPDPRECEVCVFFVGTQSILDCLKKFN